MAESASIGDLEPLPARGVPVRVSDGLRAVVRPALGLGLGRRRGATRATHHFTRQELRRCLSTIT